MKYYQLLPVILLLFCFDQAQSQKIDDAFSKDHLINDQGKERCAIDAVQSILAQQNPEYGEELKKYLEEGVPLLSRQENYARSAPIITIPVVFHIIHNGEAVGTGANISDALIQNAMDILNEDFTATNPGTIPTRWQDESGNPDIEFCFAITDPDGNATTGIDRVQLAVTGTSANNNNIDNVIKPATTWNSNLYMNIFVVGIPGTSNNGGVLGWAFFPTNGIIGGSLDGIVVDYNWVGGSSDRTITHEVGHYLGLPHTFNGTSCSTDEGVADTPNMSTTTAAIIPGLSCPNNNIPTGPTSCTEEHMFINYMDYVNDQRCYLSFSNDQINIMRAVLDGTAGGFGFGSRLPLVNNTPTVCSFFNNDAGLADVNNPGFQICGAEPIIPSVQLKNFGLSNLTSCMISYEVNDGTPIDFAWVGNLATGETVSVDLPTLTPPVDTFNLAFYTWMPNGVADEQTVNDSLFGNALSIVKEDLPLEEDFEADDTFPSTNGLRTLSVGGDALTWELGNISAFGVGNRTAVIDNYSNDLRGTLDAILTPVYDFTNVTGATLTFDIAYAPYDGTFFDSLVVLVSSDCGGLYDEAIYLNGNTGMATAPNSTAAFVPTATQWRTETIPLDAFDGVSDFSIAFLNLAGFGNRIFIDNININVPVNCKPIVINAADNGAGSLRKAVTDVCAGDTITFDPTLLSGQTITLSGTELIIDKTITIQGLGMDNLFISGQSNSRVFKINSGATLNLNELNIINPGANGSVLNQGTLNVKNVKIE